MKRFFAMVLCFVLIFTMSSCNSYDDAPISNSSSSSAEPAPPVEAGEYRRINEHGADDAEGMYILVGSYPQTAVTDEILKAELSAMLQGALPTDDDDGAWTSYKYFSNGSNECDFMWYIDIAYGEERYRGVYFTEYRSHHIYNYESSAENSLQDNNGYYVNCVYWFKYEPIKWRILFEHYGTAMLLCESSIDCQAYQEYMNYSKAAGKDGQTLVDRHGKEVVANNYEFSTIRTWLNSTFYYAAFKDSERCGILADKVDNSARSHVLGDGSNVCDNTYDYIFLLSAADLLNTEYGFPNHLYGIVSQRQKKPTDYALCQGATMLANTANKGYGAWRLRTPGPYGFDFSCAAAEDGAANGLEHLDDVSIGIAPAMWIKL